MTEDNEGYQIDQEYPRRGKRVSNTIGTIECDENGHKWLSHGKIIYKGTFEAAPEKEDPEDNEKEQK